MSSRTADPAVPAEEHAREAWERYAERLRGLEGREYEQTEGEAWDELQAALDDAPED